MLSGFGKTLEMVLWIVSQAIVALIVVILFFRYSRKRKEGLDTRFDLGLAIFFLISFFVYTFHLICSFFLTCDPIFAQLVILISAISLIEMVFAIEHIILTKNRYIMTIIYLINLLAMIIIGITTGLGFLVFPMSSFFLVLIILLPVLYFYMAYKSTGEVRRRSILFGFGFLLALMGGTLRYEVTEGIFPTLVQSNPDFFHAAPMLVLCLGLCIILYTYIKYFE